MWVIISQYISGFSLNLLHSFSLSLRRLLSPVMGVERFTAQEAAWPPSEPRVEETQAQREARLEKEREAKRVSESIDQAIIAENQKRKPVVGKILLLGQAEAGKSTTLKSFQLYFSPKAFRAEAELWRPVIHFNLLRTVLYLLALVDPRKFHYGESDTAEPPLLSDEIRRLCIRLTPLQQVQESLRKRISGSDMDPDQSSELSVHSGGRWKQLFKSARRQAAETKRDRIEEASNRRIISACSEDMVSLWMNENLQELLRQKRVDLHSQPGFFMDDIDRIVREDYVPTSQDILRARIRTSGPEEHHIPVESTFDKEWIIYDVGGSRSHRATWAQFFDNVTAIIFLAPASAFDQNLAEDSSVNRMADTISLWRSVCANKLLQSVDLILFLNKMDILDLKLKSRIQFNHYVTSYKERPNETASVAKYLLDVFERLYTQESKKRRRLFKHTTCATDMNATAIVIKTIQEMVITKALSDSQII
ncbi:guanine nucleotide binding protein, alpha subunit [Mycena floridula]|nr:guanine nucleotide binding protein, alpha subunit [Mycena floridula]